MSQALRKSPLETHRKKITQIIYDESSLSKEQKFVTIIRRTEQKKQKEESFAQ